jgi:hypothetical protein
MVGCSNDETTNISNFKYLDVSTPVCADNYINLIDSSSDLSLYHETHMSVLVEGLAILCGW